MKHQALARLRGRRSFGKTPPIASTAHGYRAQVTFLGLFAFLMGSNDA
jgi:hypothetical protein